MGCTAAPGLVLDGMVPGGIAADFQPLAAGGSIRRTLRVSRYLAVFAMAARIASVSAPAPALRRYLAAAAIALVAVCATISFARGGSFHDDIAFSRQWLRTNPESVNAHYNLGYALAKQGRAEEAAAEYQEALRILPDYALAHCNLANALSALGRLDEAAPRIIATRCG